MTLIRLEVPRDARSVQELLPLAFGGPDEARIVQQLRGSPGSISLVGEDAGQVVGHILFTSVDLDDQPTARIAGLGPMAVAPNRQGEGIGTALVAAGLAACRVAGYRAVVVIGHPSYYPRFGFRPARGFGLRAPFEVPDEAFMAVELEPGALEGGGALRFAPAFGER